MSHDHRRDAGLREELRTTPDTAVLQLEAAATALYRDGQLEKAEDLLENLVLMRPHEHTYWTLLGVVYRRRKRKAAALSCLRKAARLDRTDANTLINLAETLLEVGKLDEGVGLLRSIFEAHYDPGLPRDEQSATTIRAGAQLELVQKILEKFIGSARRDLAERDS